MDAVKSFNAELSSLYEVKPPISKAKMTSITRGAIKAIKFYKHVVQSVEKFILKCKSEYKVPGLYVIDSIVRQSRHQFGSDKDVFAPRFAKNMRQTFINLFSCPSEDKSKIIRVLNLWQKNQVFAPEVIQPLFDLADPNNPIYKELGTPLHSNGMGAPVGAVVVVKGSPALQKTPTKGSQQGIEGAHLGGASLNMTDPSVLVQLQQLQRLLSRSGESAAKSEASVHFDRKLLDFDYGDDDDEGHSTPKAAPAQAPATNDVSSLLANPEVLRQLQTLQQTMTAGQPGEMDIDKLRKLQEMKQQEDEFDKHLAQTVPNLPFASECEFKPGNNNAAMLAGGNYYMPAPADLSQPPPGFKPQQQQQQPQFDGMQQQNADNDVQFVSGIGTDSGPDVEVITLDHSDSRSPSPHEGRYNRRRRSRSRERSRERRGDRDRRSRRSRSRSRSKSRRHRSRSRDRNRTKEKEKETEKERERKKRGLPNMKKENLSVCSTTLWVGHLSKLVHQEDLSNTFGEFGDIVSIDLIPPRGCAFIVMHRRQDAARCLAKLKNHILHGKAITLAWAPGKGVKGKDLKDYWEGDLGVSYIPWSKLKPDVDVEMLEDGGMVDEDTMPLWMKAKMANAGQSGLGLAMSMEGAANYMQLEGVKAPVDTSQPPPGAPGAGLLQPPPMSLPLVPPPFQFNNRLLGNVSIPPNMLPPNVPIGVPPPNLGPGALMGLGSPFQMSQLAMQNCDKQNAPVDSNVKSLSETLLSMAQPFGLVPQPLSTSLSNPNDDNMDIEMEDVVVAEKLERPPLLSEQLQASMNMFNQSRQLDMGDLDRRGGDNNSLIIRERRNSRSRERNRDRDRDHPSLLDFCRDRDRERDRGRGGGSFPEMDDLRPRERTDDRRDRPNRWSDRDLDPIIERREREKTLNDRLQQMAMSGDVYGGNGGECAPVHDRVDPDGMGAALMDRRMYAGLPPEGPPDLNDMFMPPPEEFEHSLNGPLLDDYPPLMDHQPHPPLLDHPAILDDYPMPMHPRMHRDEYEQERFMRGRRDYRDQRGRAPGPEFFPPPPPPTRDSFGPRGLMRGGPDFIAPRGPPMMRGPGPHKFHPRGMPPMRVPRPGGGPWKQQNFGSRFEHPDFHRGGPPALFDEPPHRNNRGRFEDRRRPRNDFGTDSAGPQPDQDRYERRSSRWGDSPIQEVEDNTDIVNLLDTNSPSGVENRGGNTPLHDEPLNQSAEGNSERRNVPAGEGDIQEHEQEDVIQEAAEANGGGEEPVVHPLTENLCVQEPNDLPPFDVSE